MSNQKQTDHPHYGEVVVDKDGKVVCHICGKSYNKLLSHVWQTHGLSKHEYKEMFGLDSSKGIISESTKTKLQKAVEKHYAVVVEKNLITNGSATRYEAGHPGRTRDKVSEQTRRALTTRIAGLKGKVTE